MLLSLFSDLHTWVPFDRHEFSTALDILHKDLKVFAHSNKALYKEMAQLLALDDFRYHGVSVNHKPLQLAFCNVLGFSIEMHVFTHWPTKKVGIGN